MRTLAFGALFAFLWTGIAAAGPNADAVLSLHLIPGQVAEPCTIPEPATRPCVDLAVEGATLSPYLLYIVLARGDAEAGVAGFDFRIEYDGTALQGVDIFNWTLCADSAVPGGNFPSTLGTMRVAWNPATDCRRNVVGDEGVRAVAGAFYVYAYSDDRFTVSGPSGGAATVAACAGDDTVLEPTAATSYITFSSDGLTGGCNACVTTCTGDPVEPATWGSVKKLYR